MSYQDFPDRALIEHIAARCDRICTTLHGREGEPEKGMVVRLDRIEQDSMKARWAFGIAIGAAILAASQWLFRGLAVLMAAGGARGP